MANTTAKDNNSTNSIVIVFMLECFLWKGGDNINTIRTIKLFYLK